MLNIFILCDTEVVICVILVLQKRTDGLNNHLNVIHFCIRLSSDILRIQWLTVNQNQIANSISTQVTVYHTFKVVISSDIVFERIHCCFSKHLTCSCFRFPYTIQKFLPHVLQLSEMFKKATESTDMVRMYTI